MIKGHNNDNAYGHTGDHAVEFFSKAGSLMVAGKGKKAKKGRGTPYYGAGSEATAVSLFRPLWMMPGVENKVEAMKLLFWLRDPRGGAGNRSGFRECMRWLAQQPATTFDPEPGAAWLAVNLMRVPEWGRWDDLADLFGTDLEKMAAAVWVEAIMRGDHLACKWAKVNMHPLQRALKVNERGLRMLVVPHRATIVERAMCAQDWEQVNYSHIPSKAMSMYTKAFKKHDAARFAAYKAALVKGEKGVKINASVLFPHDCLKQIRSDPGIAEAQFKALPNFMGDAGDRRIMPIIDTSGSMDSRAMDGVTNMDVSVSLGLYLSDRLGPQHPFYRRYMEFHTTPTWKDWRNKTFVQAAGSRDGFCGSTNIAAALDFLLDNAKNLRVPADQMITHLLIVSDMQFDQGCSDRSNTVVEQCMQRWVSAGYTKPVIVYWNLSAYAGAPATADMPNTALVSGFSPAIMTSVLSGKVVTPREIMLRALTKYEIEIPVTGDI